MIYFCWVLIDISIVIRHIVIFSLNSRRENGEIHTTIYIFMTILETKSTKCWDIIMLTVETLWTWYFFKSYSTSVGFHMTGHIWAAAEPFTAYFTLKWFFSRVYSHVYCQVSPLTESFHTNCTLEWFFTSVYSH